jgi:hypothetical protein
MYSWAAICRGAVLKGLGNEVVVNHITKYHYGISYSPYFREGKHQENDKYIDEVENVPRARNQMTWFLNKVRVWVVPLVIMIFSTLICGKG